MGSLPCFNGIGVSRSYNGAVPELCSGVLPTSGQDLPGSSLLVTCLLTFPIHAYLREGDFRALLVRVMLRVLKENRHYARTAA